jgi:hypothetical protein
MEINWPLAMVAITVVICWTIAYTSWLKYNKRG